MGRRAKKAPVQTKKRPTLAKRFKCPFCAHDEVVECKMDFRAGVGSLECRLCGASYQMPIHHLHEPIDVFSEWLDDCETAQQGRNPNEEEVEEDDEDDDDDDLGEASGLGQQQQQNQQQQARKKQAAPAPAPPAAQKRQAYEALGLDDSDDDSDNE